MLIGFFDFTALSSSYSIGLAWGVAWGLGVGGLAYWWGRKSGRRRGAIESASISEAELRLMLDNTEGLMWEATVTQIGVGLDWDMRVRHSMLSRRLFPGAGEAEMFHMWSVLEVPEMAEMDRRSTDAILTGKSGYRQEFRVITEAGSTIWLREVVSIRNVRPGVTHCTGLAVDISDQRLADLARRASERSLAEILNRADCLVWRSEVRRVDDRFVWERFEIPRSALYLKLFGERPTSVDGDLWNGVTVPELAEMNQRSSAAMEEGAPRYDQEFSVINRAGVISWLHEQVSIERVSVDGWQLVGVITDITARREAEQAVRDSAQRFESLFEHMPVAITETDLSMVGVWLDGLRKAGVTDLAAYLQANPVEVARGAMKVHVLSVNEAGRKLTGVPSTRALRWRRQLLSTESAMRAIREAFVALWEGRNILQTEVEIRQIGGDLRRTDMRWWVARTERGFDLRRSLMIYVDVTDLKRVEADLAAQRERMAVTLRSMKEGVITTHRDGRVRFFNAAAAGLTGWSEQEAVGANVSDVVRLGDEESGTAWALPMAETTQSDFQADFPSGVILSSRAGNRYLVEGQLAPVHDSSGQVVGCVLVFRDVTDRERLEQEMVRATRLESVGLLAGGIAHDFNNILTTVVGNLSVARLDLAEASLAGACVRDAERAAFKARDLTQQLLTFARGGEPVRAAVEMRGLIREMVGFALHGSNVRADLRLPDDLWLADVDKGQIGRVVQNLVINAVQAMPQGGVVTIRAANEVVAGFEPGRLKPGNYIHLEVEDSGVGIAPEALGRIFDPYFTTKRTGTGLGLAAAYSIVRKHQGLIEVSSTVDVGSTFGVWLPVAREAVAPEGLVKPSTNSPLSGRILFMDDEASIREMTQSLLRRLGLTVEITADGAELVNAYQRGQDEGRHFDLVITDLTVPGGIGGLEALRRLKEVDPAAKVVVSSGYSSDPVMANFRSHGFVGMLSKPYELSDLRRVLQEVMGLQVDAGEV